VNLIRKLFSHRHGEEPTTSALVTWQGQSGKQYQYEVFPLDAAFQHYRGTTSMQECRRTERGFRSMSRRPGICTNAWRGHVRVDDAIFAGRTNLHAHYDTQGQAARCSEEHDLVLRWQPVCNDPVES
jgi:hypothetical protein